MSSVSERLLKEIKICNVPSEWLKANIDKILFYCSFSGSFFSGRRILIFTFGFCFLQQSFMLRLLFRNHVSSWSLAGIAQQSQVKQVPVLRLSSVSGPFRAELLTPLLFCRVHGKCEICDFSHIKWNIVQWHELKRNKATQEFLFCFSCLLIPDLSKGITSDLIKLSTVTWKDG